MKEERNISNIKGVLDEFRRLHKSFHELMSIAVRKHNLDISPEQSQLLFVIYYEKISSQKEIAKKMRITPATLSVRIQRLESAGYLRRKIDTNDKRNYILQVEPKGKELVAKSHRIIDGVMLQMFQGFTEKDIQELIHYMDRLKTNVKRAKEDMQCLD